MSGRSMRAVYEGLAEALFIARPAPFTPRDQAAYDGWTYAVDAVAGKLEALNPGFDRRRFLVAAGRLLPGLQDETRKALLRDWKKGAS
jgi:hypothetical protein